MEMMRMINISLISEEQQPSTSRDPEFCPCLDSSKPHKITEIVLNNLIRNLELPKNKAELLASKLTTVESSTPFCESDNFPYRKQRL
jgi:hypothetical protein